MPNDSTMATVLEARAFVVPVCINVLDLDYRKGGLAALECAKKELEEAVRALDHAIAKIDAERFNGTMREINASVDLIKELGA